MATREYDIPALTHRSIKKTFASFLILLFAVVATHGQTVELTLHPAKVAEPVDTCRLLPGADKQTDEDAVPLYEQAIQRMPTNVNQKQIRTWLDLPVEQFPQQEAEAILQKHIESLRLVMRASRCKVCRWSEWKPGDAPLDLGRFKDLIPIIRLWARMDLSRGQYKGALVAMQTALGLTRHLGQIPSLVEALVATAVGRAVCQELEQFVQGQDSPNLHGALTNLPEPLIDVEKAIEKEWGHLQASLMQKPSEKQLNAANELYDRIRRIAKRLDNHVNALQVVEAIRHYAATHEGQLPQVIDDISDIEVPNDLVSGKAFEYRRTASGATLKSAIPEGFKERHAIHYEIALKE